MKTSRRCGLILITTNPEQKYSKGDTEKGNEERQRETDRQAGRQTGRDR